MSLHYNNILIILEWQYQNGWPLKTEDPIRFKLLIEKAKQNKIKVFRLIWGTKK